MSFCIGKLYYQNGIINCERIFINHKPEIFGKYYYENSEYYIGECKNDLRHGKGTEY